MNHMMALQLATVPKLTVFVRKVYGQAYLNLGGGRNSDEVLAWPTAEVGFMAPAAGVTVVPYEAQDQVYLDIKAGRLDGTVADKVEVNGGFLSKPEGKGYGFVGADLYDVKYFGYGVGVAMRKGQDKLKADVNAAIKAIRSDARYATISKKYFSFDPYGN